MFVYVQIERMDGLMNGCTNWKEFCSYSSICFTICFMILLHTLQWTVFSPQWANYTEVDLGSYVFPKKHRNQPDYKFSNSLKNCCDLIMGLVGSWSERGRSENFQKKFTRPKSVLWKRFTCMLFSDTLEHTRLDEKQY